MSPNADDASPETVPAARSTAAPGGATVRHGGRWWVAASVSIAFGLLYAWDLFEAISNLLGVAQVNGIATDAGIEAPVPWILPIAAAALPPVAYLVAFLIGRRHRLGIRALLFLVGLAVVAASTLSLTALALAITAPG